MRVVSIIISLIIIGASPGPVVAQHKKKVENVKGEWVISNDITPLQARQNAINQAKIEALRQAGVPEILSESNLTYHSEKLEQMQEIFKSLATVSISGEISEFKIVKEEKKLNEFGNIQFDVWIDATVLLHKSARDEGFNLEVKGVRETYASPDLLNIDITPWKDGYLTIFILGESESAQLFPNPSEHQGKLNAQTAYHFPKSSAVEYEVSTENSLEINYLLLLFTKEEIPFVLEPTDQNILKFVAQIDPSAKCLKTYSLLIKKQQ